jgi:type III pantothenate kinase
MKPHIVVDVGNSRVKWGLCSDAAVSDSASLPHDDPAAWQHQLERWQLSVPLIWVAGGVHPRTCDQLADWVRRRGDALTMLEFARSLPLRVEVERPDWVGIDRLLDAVAANSRRREGVPAVIVDAGSAVTVDYVDEAGAFRGGSIFPGLRLMVRALNAYTALLPLVEINHPIPPLPAPSTPTAMQAGVYWVVVGGIQALVRRLQPRQGPPAAVYLTGGDARLLEPGLEGAATVWPTMTLEGIRLSAESLP